VSADTGKLHTEVNSSLTNVLSFARPRAVLQVERGIAGERSGDTVASREEDRRLLEVARNARGKMRPGGTLLLMGGTGGRKISRDLGIVSAATAVLPPFTAALALALAPVRVNLIAAGFVDTPLSASLLGDGLEARREELRTTLPIGRVVGPADVAALAVHIMTNTALTGATYDIDGGQQFVA
jgi:NAD(P)-dependent dehydrogenase (short-subunit alcohol dehydrogenase family)